MPSVPIAYDSLVRSAVIDVGSALTKAGLSGEELPREVYRSCLGVPRHTGTRASLLHHACDIVAGDEANAERGLLNLRFPVQHGHIEDFEDFERLLFYTLYDRLEVAPDQTPCLMLEPADITRKDREKLAEVFFESFNVPLLGLLNMASSTIFSTGRTSGISLDSGAGKTMIAAVSDGYRLAHAMRPSFIAGDMLTQELFDVLRDKGYPLSTERDWELVQHIKESMCTASLDLEEDLHRIEEKGSDSYALPDNERIFIFDSRYTIPERLFNPSLLQQGRSKEDAEVQKPLGMEESDVLDLAALRPPTPTGYSTSNPNCRAPLTGWVEAIEEVISVCHVNLHEDLFSNIVLGGGTTRLRNLEKRLQRDLYRRNPPGIAKSGLGERLVQCIAFAERAQAAWIGGSVWSCSAHFPHLCLPKAEYHDVGASAVHKYAY